MDEVHVRAVGHVGKRWGATAYSKLIPPHVWHLESRRSREPYHIAIEESQPIVFAVFIALREKKLQPQADAQEWLAGVYVLDDRASEVCVMESCDGISKRPDSGQDKLVCPGNHIRVAGEEGRVPNFH